MNRLVLEYGLRMESCENFEYLGENSKRTMQGSSDLSFLQNMSLFFECLFVPLPGKADTRASLYHTSLEMAIDIGMRASM